MLACYLWWSLLTIFRISVKCELSNVYVFFSYGNNENRPAMNNSWYVYFFNQKSNHIIVWIKLWSKFDIICTLIAFLREKAPMVTIPAHYQLLLLFYYYSVNRQKPIKPDIEKLTYCFQK